MLETQTRSSSRSYADAASSRAASGYRGASPQVTGYPPRLTVETSGSRVRSDAGVARRRRSAVRRKGLRLNGESAAVVSVVICFTVVCAIGIIYLGAYAYVALQSRQVHSLQSEVNVADAQHDVLVAQYTQLSYGKRVLSLASQENMVAGGPAEYITLSANSSDARRMAQVASAR